MNASISITEKLNIINEKLNEASRKFHCIRSGRYVVTPQTYKEECGCVTIGGGELIDKETGELVE